MGILAEVKNETGQTVIRIPYNEKLRMAENKDAVENYIIDTIHKEGYLTKNDLIRELKNKYSISISNSTLKYYNLKKLITPGINCKVDHFRGSVSLYVKKTPRLIALIKYLKDKKKYKLVELERYFKTLYFHDVEKLKELYGAIHQGDLVKIQGRRTMFGKLAGELMYFQEIAIYRSLLEIGEFKQPFSKVSLDPDITVDIKKDIESRYFIIVDLPRYKRKVIYTEEGIKIDK